MRVFKFFNGWYNHVIVGALFSSVFLGVICFMSVVMLWVVGVGEELGMWLPVLKSRVSMAVAMTRMDVAFLVSILLATATVWPNQGLWDRYARPWKMLGVLLPYIIYSTVVLVL